jgi:hypothetical protein
MVCPFLYGSKIRYCLAEKRLFVPSLLELREFCCEDPVRCPLFGEAESAQVPKKEMHTTPMYSLREKLEGRSERRR